MNEGNFQLLRDFVEASPTAWQTVDSISALLEARGAQRLDDRREWELEPGCTYYVERGGSALVAFRPGLRPPAEEGFAVAGAHTDSPGLKLRIGKSVAARGMERCAVEVYGGPIISTWLDRPLALAGRVVTKEGGRQAVRLVNIERPVGIIPNLAIHLNRDMNKGVEYNAQAHLPVLLSSMPPSSDPEAPGGQAIVSAISSLVAGELGIDVASILSADLFFVDAQKVTLIGEDLVNGPRLDNLLGCHSILEAFIASKPAPHGQVAVFFDNEEIGSRTMMGADSSFLRDLLGRVASLQGTNTEGYYRALASSFSVSVDVAQAWHPGWQERFDERFSPLLNGGPAVKSNANFRYATDALSEARFRAFCDEAKVPCQKFMTRADMSPGSTIGPVSAAHTGIATVDVGAPLLSMHSIRETSGRRDHAMMIAALERHFSTSPRLP